MDSFYLVVDLFELSIEYVASVGDPLLDLKVLFQEFVNGVDLDPSMLL
jgi:hypothetical protein